MYVDNRIMDGYVLVVLQKIEMCQPKPGTLSARDQTQRSYLIFLQTKHFIIRCHIGTSYPFCIS